MHGLTIALYVHIVKHFYIYMYIFYFCMYLQAYSLHIHHFAL
nr:MAG TPA: hypothetical protein [Caudoviricetes sp.]